MSIDDLSDPERLVVRSYPCGAWVDLGPGDEGSDGRELGAGAWLGGGIRAGVIRAVLLGLAAAEPGYAAGLRVRGAPVTGVLDLAGITISHAVVFENCQFDDEIRLAESVTRSIRLAGSRLPGFDGTRLQADGILDFSGCAITGAVRLDQAKITGQVCLAGAAAGAGTVAVSAGGLWVDGSVECAGLTAAGAVALQGCRVTGSVDLTGARITRPGATALELGNAQLGGRLIGRGLQVDGEMLLHDAHVARIELAGARLHNPAGFALSAGGLAVSGGMFCTGGFSAVGVIWLVGARLGANLSLREATLASPGKTALNLTRAAIGDFDGSGLTCSGQVRVIFARIASGLNLASAQLDSGPGQAAFTADGAVIDGTLQLSHLRARGEVKMTTGRVGQRIILTAAQLENPAGIALRLSGTEVAADIFCRDATFLGGVRLVRARIGSHLDLDHVRLICPGGYALDAKGLQAGDLSLHPAEPVQGTVDLGHARIGILGDDPGCWPGQLNLDGLTYLALEPQLPARERLHWLTRHRDGHNPQPYEQLAAYYTSIGQPTQARQVWHARERRQRHSRPPLARAWSLLQDVTVGYGYQPWRALLWLAVLLATGSIVFATAPPPPLQPSAAPHFNAIIYTLDLLLPVVDLGQKHAFNPAGAEQWLSYFLIAAGWILVTTIAAGAARVLSRR